MLSARVSVCLRYPKVTCRLTSSLLSLSLFLSLSLSLPAVFLTSPSLPSLSLSIFFVFLSLSLSLSLWLSFALLSSLYRQQFISLITLIVCLSSSDLVIVHPSLLVCILRSPARPGGNRPSRGHRARDEGLRRIRRPRPGTDHRLCCHSRHAPACGCREVREVAGTSQSCECLVSAVCSHRTSVPRTARFRAALKVPSPASAIGVAPGAAPAVPGTTRVLGAVGRVLSYLYNTCLLQKWRTMQRIQLAVLDK